MQRTDICCSIDGLDDQDGTATSARAGGVQTYTTEAYNRPPKRKWDTGDCQRGPPAETIRQWTSGDGSNHGSDVDNGRKNGGLDGGEMEVSHHTRKRRRRVTELRTSNGVREDDGASLDGVANAISPFSTSNPSLEAPCS